jgi:ABC-type Na+ efflux pump permease subunit
MLAPPEPVLANSSIFGSSEDSQSALFPFLFLFVFLFLFLLQA